MSIRADIDNQDIVNALRETRPRFPADLIAHAATLGLAALVFAGAGAGAYGAFREIAGDGLSPQKIIQSAAAPTPAGYILLSSLVLVALSIFGAVAAIRARRKSKRIALEEAQTAGTATGRFDYAFTAAHLVIQSARSVRKTPGLSMTASKRQNPTSSSGKRAAVSTSSRKMSSRKRIFSPRFTRISARRSSATFPARKRLMARR